MIVTILEGAETASTRDKRPIAIDACLVEHLKSLDEWLVELLQP